MSLVVIAVLALLALCLVCGAILGFAAVRFRVEGDPIAEQINALLPQTQCGQCGYPGCKPYAEAIAGGDNHRWGCYERVCIGAPRHCMIR
jgi:electron transport complex protein RnfB